MTYISGFTNIATGQTTIDNKYHETYSIDDLYVNLIKPTLFNHGVVLTEKFLAEALCKLPKEYKMEVDMLKNRVLLKREAVKAGYIYNSKKQELLYSFFFEKISEEGIQQTPEEAQSVIEEIEEVESKIVEEIKKVESKIIEEIKKPDFIEELTIKLGEKTEREVYQEPQEQPPVKTEFQLELEKEVDLREKRKKTRETKLQKKKERRTRKLD
jgi:hypothetical protein